MKRLTISCLTLIFALSAISAQTLETIIKQHTAAMHADKLAAVKTIKITGRMSALGMDMPMTMYMKNPDKIKVTYSAGGNEMVSVFNGTKGYTVNPTSGSRQPVELTGEQLKQFQGSNLFNNELLKRYNARQVTLEGTEDVNGSPANKLKITTETGQPIYMFVDRKTGLITKTTTVMGQTGASVNLETYMSDYADINGIVLPRRTSVRISGIETAAIIFDQIETDIPMDDSVFTAN
ncbi:MAG: hypothetical protein LBV26_00960 [Bacteroidales bacterium]|jgi:outer membrane lipoprotein-sorting protein|nr:hypothetical protein [Bacteroidales bacterium]